MPKRRAIVLRKFNNPVIEVYYKNRFIGHIENQTELLWFRIDVINSGESEHYTLSCNGETQGISKYGLLDNWTWYEEYDKALPDVVHTQMNLRKKDAEIRNTAKHSDSPESNR